MWLNLGCTLINQDNVIQIYARHLSKGTIGVFLSMRDAQETMIAEFDTQVQVKEFVGKVKELISNKVEVIDIAPLVNVIKMIKV